LNKQRNYFNIIVLLVFILPFITAIITAYTIYLKYEMNTLKIQINDLRTEVEDFMLKEEISIDQQKKFDIPDIKPKIFPINYDLENVDYFILLKNSMTSFKEYNEGALKIFEDEKEAFEEAVFAFKNNIEYFFYSYNDMYYLFRKDYDTSERQRVYFTQMYLYTAPQNAFLPTLTLRNAGMPVYVFNGKFQQSNEDYYAIATSFFFNRADADKFRLEMDEDLIVELTGLSTKDRFLKIIYFEGQK